MNQPVGRVAKEFGLSGELTVNLYDTFPQEADFEEPLFVVIDGLAVPLFFESFSRRGVSGAVVRFADFDTPQRAAELIGKELLTAADNEEVEDDSEIYLEDFVGYTALVEGDEVKGRIVDYVDNDFNPLFVAEFDGSEVLIPATDEMIVDYSVGRREVTFALPEGLFELNRSDQPE